MPGKVFAGVGDEVARFAERFVRQTKGRWAGKPLDFEGWQRELLDELFLLDDQGDFVYREALIGVPRKNGKSTLCAAIALYALMNPGEPGAEVYSAASSRDQARVVFDQARAFVESSPLLSDWLTPMRNAIVCPSNGGIYRVLSADGAKQHGLNPSCVIIDELHAFNSPGKEELYYALTTGQMARKSPLVVSITTAGYDEETVCYRVFEHGRKLEEGGVDAMRDARFFFRWYQADDGCELDDAEQWAKANPSSWITDEDLLRASEQLPEHVFRRLHLNQWTAAADAWLPPGAWDKCCESGVTIPEHAEVYLGVDVGLKHDTSAVVTLWRRPDDQHWVVESEIFKPPEGQGRSLDLSVVEQAIRDRADKHEVLGVVYDRWSFERSSQQLSDEGLLMIEAPMTNERMVPASVRLYDAINDQRIHHNGDPELARHVAAGATRDTERGWRISKGKASKKIDALVAMCIALDVAERQDRRVTLEWI